MDRRQELMNLVRRKTIAGLRAAVAEAARIYKERVTDTIEEPILGPRGGISFAGPSSQIGEFPHAETQQGAENIDHGVDVENLVGRFGVRGEDGGIGPFAPTHDIAGGLHLFFLSENMGRLGLTDVWLGYREEISQAYIVGANSVEA